MIWLLVAIYILILLTEVPPLIKKRMVPELGAFFAFFLIGVYMSLAFYYEWPLIGPFDALMKCVETI